METMPWLKKWLMIENVVGTQWNIHIALHSGEPSSRLNDCTVLSEKL